jgi:putative SOS response-associated peptidase YedK
MVNQLSAEDWRDLFGLSVEPEPSEDLRPGEVVWVVRGSPPQAFLAVWGVQRGRLLINARSETAAQKPSFAAAFRGGRCLVPVTGWWEWDAERVRHRIARSDGKPVVMAGLLVEERLVILTCDASPALQPLHPRMPAIVPRRDWALWLGQASPDRHTALLTPFPDKVFAVQAVPIASKRDLLQQSGQLF